MLDSASQDCRVSSVSGMDVIMAQRSQRRALVKPDLQDELEAVIQHLRDVRKAAVGGLPVNHPSKPPLMGPSSSRLKPEQIMGHHHQTSETVETQKKDPSQEALDGLLWLDRILSGLIAWRLDLYVDEGRRSLFACVTSTPTGDRIQCILADFTMWSMKILSGEAQVRKATRRIGSFHY